MVQLHWWYSRQPLQQPHVFLQFFLAHFGSVHFPFSFFFLHLVVFILFLQAAASKQTIYQSRVEILQELFINTLYSIHKLQIKSLPGIFVVSITLFSHLGPVNLPLQLQFVPSSSNLPPFKHLILSSEFNLKTN